jgi:hypothetical protein
MELMNKARFNKVWVGVIIGLLGAILGFVIFGFVFAIKEDMTFYEFYRDVFLGVANFQSRIISFSVLLDIILFYIFIRKDYQQMCKGIMAVLVLAVIVVAWLY